MNSKPPFPFTNCPWMCHIILLLFVKWWRFLDISGFKWRKKLDGENYSLERQFPVRLQNHFSLFVSHFLLNLPPVRVNWDKINDLLCKKTAVCLTVGIFFDYLMYNAVTTGTTVSSLQVLLLVLPFPNSSYLFMTSLPQFPCFICVLG